MRRTVICLLAVLLAPGPVGAGIGAREYRAAVKAMAEAVRDFDTAAFIASMEAVLRRDDSAAVKAATDAYAELLTRRGDELGAGEFYLLHGRAAKSFSAVSGERALGEMRRQQRQHGHWQGRLLLLDAASFNESLDLVEAALAALEDHEPAVIRRALQYLSRVKKRSVVEAILRRSRAAVAAEEKGARKNQSAGTEFLFQAALTTLLEVELPTLADYANYVAGREDDELFNPPRVQSGARTGLTLFGASVTGKNIVFILDTSGSMLTTDPATGPSQRQPTARTVVAGSRRDGPRAPREDRQRLARAKKELAKVVRALPEDVRFNIISFATGIDPWKNGLVPAGAASKKEALRFIDSMRAAGVTAMDLALEEGFADLSVDTVYLVTDGAPTHVGSDGALPVDAPELMKSIQRRMKAINFLRGVRIFTLGFQGAEEEFLEELSRDHSGRYVRIE